MAAHRSGVAFAREVVFLADGAPWLWQIAAAQFPQAIQILDYYHVIEHLYALAHARFGEGTAGAKAWVQARRFGTTWQQELVRYIVHGLLHLNGYDDRRQHERNRMKRRENQLVRVLTSEFCLERLSRRTVRAKVRRTTK